MGQEGRLYSSCTTDGQRDKKLWWTTTDNYDKDDWWRFCSPMGPDSLPCTFSFKYKGKSSSACTRDGSTDKWLWCATTGDYDKDGKWKFCTRKGESLHSVSRCLERVAAENTQSQDRSPENRADTPKLPSAGVLDLGPRLVQDKPLAGHEMQAMSIGSLSPLRLLVPSRVQAALVRDHHELRHGWQVEVLQRDGIPQYPLSKAAKEGIRPVLVSLIQQGVIVQTSSECNTPILPVRKPGTGKWRFVQDLRAVNAVVHPLFPVVPNPATILSSIPPSATYFTVVDLCSAFFSIPIHPESQYLFAFTFQGLQYTWTRLPQGYTESPTIFCQILRKDLENVTLPKGSTLVQYVDDLLIASPTLEACQVDSLALLQALAKKGHKASKSKLQLCLPRVHYLGHDLTAGERHLSRDRIKALLQVPRPATKRQLRGFLGMAGYCRQWIAEYASVTKPLHNLTHKDVPEPLPWTQTAETAFKTLKELLASAPALGIPDYSKTFTLFCQEKDGIAQGVLTQKHGDSQRPVAYYSAPLDSVAAGLPPCLRAVAAAAILMDTSAALFLGSPLLVSVPYAVTALLLRGATQHMSNSRLTKYEMLLLNAPNVTLVRCPVLNPASLLPTAWDGEPHDCQAVTTELCSPRIDLGETPLPNPELIYFVDGSCLRNPKGILVAGYAICSPHNLVEAHSLPGVNSAQVAELIALTRACTLAEKRSINIYTDSRYAFGVVHDYGQLWKCRPRWCVTTMSYDTDGRWRYCSVTELALLLHDMPLLPCDNNACQDCRGNDPNTNRCL
ncbi:uncharacterized protein LOC113409400, partial [Terrapene carolina triunguis]|uniref:uncharacterized protein LOC113409400 n=1 Tax=Terrapene triunguis TaxID=2587831 RepID=UPI000E778440